MKKDTATNGSNYCTVLEQRHLVKEMTACDKLSDSGETYECYLKATQESRENNACMYA